MYGFLSNYNNRRAAEEQTGEQHRGLVFSL